MIKFRAWDKVQKVMMVPRDIQTDSDGNIFYVEAMGPDGEYDEGDLDVFKLEQSTGLQDANGKEIYEGDILEVTIDGTVQADKYLVKNMWDPHVWTEESDGYYAVSKMKVQGNVHENPELLEDKHVI